MPTCGYAGCAVLQANPHISDDDKGIITQRIYDAIEAHVPYPDVWATVHANTPASIKGCRTVEQLEEAHDGHNPFQWHELYRSVGVETWASESEINAALQLGGGARIEVYWRALGRFPGGNADMLTVCYSFKCGGPAAPASVSVRKYSNWDGSHSNCEFVPEALTADLAKPEKLPRLLGSLRGYLSGPSRDSQFTFHDTSSDSEEYDSEWSSTEILMLLPRRWSPAAHPFFPKAVRDSVLTVMLANQRVRGAERPALSMDELRLVFAAFVPSIDHVPVLRLHRQCVTGPTQAYWSRPATEGEPVVAPNPQQQAVIEAAEVVVGMGRVNTYSDAGDGEDPCLAAGETEVDIESNQCDFRIRLPYVHPCYFRWAAKNC